MRCTAPILISPPYAGWSSRGPAWKCAASDGENAMATLQPMKESAAARTGEPLAVRIAHSVVSMSLNDLPVEVTDKVKLCLFDLIGCAFESRDLPWSRQAIALAEGTGDAATVIGSPRAASHADAAFANAVMGHGLVREDMHSGSIS